MKNKKSLLAFIIAIYVFAATCLSVFYVSSNIKHECNEGHCEICIHINQAESFLKQLATAEVVGVFSVPFLCLFLLLLSAESRRVHSTLISMKVRLNN